MKIFVLSAFELETNPIVHAFHLKKEKPFGFVKRWSSDRFDLLQTNIGKVHAAATTQFLIDHKHPDWIVNVGMCGGFAKEVIVGDVVMPTSVIQYDIDQRKLGFPLGRIHALEKIQLPLKTLEVSNCSYKKGVCITADKILSDKKEGRDMYTLFHPAVVDMELGSIAQVCYLNKTNLLALKSPADIVEKEEVTDFEDRATLCMNNLMSVLDRVIATILAT